MKVKIKDYEGAFSVEGRVTPISHQEIENVNADQWHLLPTPKLHHQLVILNKRLHAALTTNSMDIVKQLEQGVGRLQLIIKERDEDDKLI